MESQPPIEAVNTLPPENLPPANHVPVPLGPRVFDQRQKLAIVIELVKSGEPTSVIAARHGILPRLLRNWSNSYNKRAFEIIKKEQAEAANYQPEKQTGKKLEQANVKELKDMGKSIPPRPHKYASVPEEIKKKTVKMIKAGKVLKDVAKELGLSTHTARMAFEKDTGVKLSVHKLRGALAVAKATAAGPLPEVTGGRVIETSTGARRLYTEKEKFLFAVRFKKLGVNLSDGARALGVGLSALRDWVIKYEKMKPQQKAAISNAEHGKISDETKLRAIAAIDEGRTARDIAQEIGVHQDSIKHWYLKTGRKWPSQWKAKANAQRATFKRAPNGPQKKTLQRMAVRDALLSNGEVIAAQELNAENMTHANGHAQPISTGKAVHDATIFLQLARDEFQKAVKAGKLRVDDPTMLLPMLALHTLSK